MSDPTASRELQRKVLTPLYTNAVVGALNSTAMALGMASSVKSKNPRYADLRHLFDTCGPDNRRQFYAAVASIVEFAAYCVLDFVEGYNRFDSGHNDHEYP